ncbi:MAG: HAMP domain-containing protein [Acidobacteria bacterium]|nr:HAMP domain-containing protein [Acidobacteriota bacterium]
MSIRWRLIIGVTGLLLVVSVLSIIITYRRVHASMAVEFDDKGTTMVRILSSFALRGVIYNDPELQQSAIQGITGGGVEQDVAYIGILDPKGQVLSESGRNELAGVSKPDLNDKAAIGEPIHFVYKGEQFLDVFLPITSEGKIYGFSRIVLSFAAHDRLVRRLLYTVIVTTVVLMGLGFIGAWFVARNLVTPVERAAHIVRLMAQGDLTKRIEVRSKDEVGVLANSVNTLADNLQKSMESLVGKDQLETLIKQEREAKELLQSKVEEFVQFTEKIGKGDLTAALKASGSDELSVFAHHLNQMVESLKRITGQVKNSTVSITSAISQILTATTQQSSLGTEQASSINEISATVDEVRLTSEHTSNLASSVADSTKKVIEVSKTGEEAVEESIKGMSQIKDKVESIAENILALSEQTQQIGEIISTVNDIAEQSNLLALNASIEAARAGEHGKGFAVVANEVRNLAEQSKQATAQVRSILNDIQKATNSAVMVTEQGSKEVDRGVLLVNQAGKVIHHLIDTITTAATAAEQIVSSVKEQTIGMSQISVAMGEIKQAASEMQDSAEQVVHIAQNLSEQCNWMNELVAKYKI